MQPTDPDFIVTTRVSDAHGEISVNAAVVGPADGPLVVCVHGWPESWWSYRHQMEHLSSTGHRVASIDVRGYGASSKPEAIDAYRLRELADDVAAVIANLSPDAPAVVIGHDWGAPVAWQTARLHPELVRGVIGMSVPYRPTTPGDPMELWDLVYADRFFYMKYFQEPGVAEAELEADVARTLRMAYWAAGGESGDELWMQDRPADAGFLDGMVDPDPVPEWMDAEALGPATAALEAGGFQGPLNRYRAQGLDADDLPGLADDVITVPAAFIGGERDIVRAFVPGMDMFASAGEFLGDFRGWMIVPAAGHWVQQERPDATNAAIDEFLAGL